MARRSQRISSATSPAVKHKRAASGSSTAATVVKRTKKQQVTPTKSQYFEPGESDQPDDSTSAGNDTGSDFEGDEPEDDDDRSQPEDSAEDSAEDDSDDDIPRKKGKASNGELWKAGVKTGLGPGKQVIIKKPKARPAGKTPYVDEFLHPNTFHFLADLKANNQRAWLKSKLFSF